MFSTWYIIRPIIYVNNKIKLQLNARVEFFYHVVILSQHWTHIHCKSQKSCKISFQDTPRDYLHNECIIILSHLIKKKKTTKFQKDIL